MQKEETGNERRPLRLIIIIFIAIFIILVVGLLFYFNIGGISNHTLKYFSNIPILKGLIQVKPTTNYADELKKLTSELNTKQKELQNAEISLSDKQKQIDELQLQLQKQQNELNSLKVQVNSKKTDLKTLATYYENMDPQNAANILNQITDNNILIGILGNMNKDNASKILEQLDPKKAADITKILYTNASTVP
ncbi:hypothetical protein BFT35_04535 [Thermoanaerobacterium thermosaccharolyticum]|jgi:flagellar protein FlbB|uniref:Magnesium transporter MgtE intracellular domain-containing protein n=2 Tax=Thermoanaerobacterium thermosaccharolyticum TaxID=1517 RepID=D9TN54_THETC|nr:hypothetical protein [Thermoanaerobacterium thermosaccharolyticum]ADL68964.1 conserved hypothetical protein [Thermoanaerobacterium thermosaccharolyticum DSM 571]MBE0068021.1 hypothetical protein [Thermoanaerobacterium thermosaccharolyticum]MBE0227765.1 hypothetical protein [Thermoanaerobacterium thermosaccharolyticum]MCP2240048.1 flagellar motility protein MotE (MotC chaperone) [Thermoanaerobacterium thermosaccharolyticum]OXT07499.1 hypothetical protein CE561_06660 [Thermoanaerobacterium th